jgi:hypothetical protein
LRLAGISTIEKANKFLEETNYWEKHNKRFAVEPECHENVHVTNMSEDFLDNKLCLKELRKLSKNLEFQYKNIIYQVTEKPTWKILRAQVTVITDLHGFDSPLIELPLFL